MQIISIHLKNIKSHRDRELSFSSGINVLSGPNGVGKSTVFEAIGYALFGVDARDFVTNIDRFLSIGAKKGEISVVFKTSNDELWKVSRTVGTPSKWLLYKESGGSFEVEEHANTEETEARIAELLGLNNGRRLADQFKLVIGPFQNEFLGPFVIKQQTKRQEAFDEILGIDAWRTTYKGTSDLLKAIQKKIEVLSAEIKLLQDQVAVLPQKQEEQAAIATTLQQKQGELQQKQAALKQAESQLIDLDAQEKALTALTIELQRTADRIKDGTDKIADKQKEVDTSWKAKAVVEASRAGKEAYDVAEVHLTELRAKEQQRRAAEKEITALEKEAQRLTQSVEHEQAEIAKTEALLAEEKSGFAAARTSLQPNQAMQDAVAGLPTQRTSLERLKADLAQLSGRRAGLEEGQDKLAEGVCPFFQEKCRNLEDRPAKDLITKKLTDLDQTQTILNELIATLTQQVKAAEVAEKELHGLTVRLQELDKQVATLATKRAKNQERATKLEGLKQQQATAAAKVLEHKALLQAFANLDSEIEQAEQLRKQHQESRDAFTTNLKDAEELESRLQTLEKWQAKLVELKQEQADKQAELIQSKASYQVEQHQQLRADKDRLLTEVATITQQIESLTKDQQRLSQEILSLLCLQENAASKQTAITSYTAKEKLVKFLRNQVFKNVSEQLSERFREEISLRADRIYRTIAESDEELHWGEKYQIILRDMHDGQLRERTDDQLSGGQTMSAVVALRLALLQTIGARIAFFDEPTSNLDAARRENLAHAFRAIDVGREEVTEHWYDQLFLISHDVAFTEITDQMLQVGC
ncbi:MAG: SMC family ATPase [Trichlorobacter sp.]|uniref:AAA family ATPase n=1 Tax=Trichlorobacter sp. TaxID=2911007 RepID=UPI002564DB78|nr:SMC family ATPase [Trichlorobacter sp.]MDK9718255.1 SMC family ATPase [Trichlorobacter sp.]